MIQFRQAYFLSSLVWSVESFKSLLVLVWNRRFRNGVCGFEEQQETRFRRHAKNSLSSWLWKTGCQRTRGESTGMTEDNDLSSLQSGATSLRGKSNCKKTRKPRTQPLCWCFILEKLLLQLTLYLLNSLFYRR